LRKNINPELSLQHKQYCAEGTKYVVFKPYRLLTHISSGNLSPADIIVLNKDILEKAYFALLIATLEKN
jgi:hypothetical protein